MPMSTFQVYTLFFYLSVFFVPAAPYFLCAMIQALRKDNESKAYLCATGLAVSLASMFWALMLKGI